MVATEEQTSPSRITARLFAWLAPPLLFLAAFIGPTVSAKTSCVSHNRTVGNSTAAVQWCPAQGPRTGALNWEKLPGEYVPVGSGFANAARTAGQISADWAAENSGELGGLRPTYDEAAIATSGPVGDLGDAVVGKVTESIAPVAKGIAAKLSDIVGKLFGKGGEEGGGVQANKLAGDMIRDKIAAREAPAKTEQTFRTIGGTRRVDVLKIGDGPLAIESKVGRTSLGIRGGRVRQELARDWWLKRQGQVGDIRWEFSRSGVTGEVGPTAPLLQKLQKLGFEIRINQ